MSAEWYYAKNNRQFGPVSPSQLSGLVESGELSADDLVWKDGMTHWQAVARARHLFESAAAPMPVAAPVQQQQYGHPQQGQLGYYSVTTDISVRTRQILRGFPPPTGPRGDWPLTDAHLAQLAETERHRRAIRGFNSICHVLILLMILFAIGALGMLVGAPGGRVARNPVVMIGGISLAVYVALGVLFYICGRAALKARIWGPITVSAILALGIILITIGAVSALGSGPRGDDVTAVLVMFFILLIGGALLWVSIRGIIAIPKFLNSPVWAQEALVHAKL